MMSIEFQITRLYHMNKSRMQSGVLDWNFTFPFAVELNERKP